MRRLRKIIPRQIFNLIHLFDVARLLLALTPDVKQLNVFTHKRDFLYMLCDKISENKVLHIRSDKKNGSRAFLAEFNIGKHYNN